MTAPRPPALICARNLKIVVIVLVAVLLAPIALALLAAHLKSERAGR